MSDQNTRLTKTFHTLTALRWCQLVRVKERVETHRHRGWIPRFLMSASGDYHMSTKQFNINQASQLTGLSPSVLRIWELRYHWPKPARKSNGYRIYKPALIEDLKWVADRIAHGKTIRELVCEGKLVRDELPKRKKRTPSAGFDFSSIAPPTTSEGLLLRERLENAIRIGDSGQVALVQSMAVRLRPDEREAAVNAVLRVFGPKEECGKV